jgi:hypothetical protein
MDISQDATAMLPSGDFEKLDKREKEAFHALQEKMVSMLMQESNHFKTQFPGLHIEWRWQVEVYQRVVNGPSSVRYSDRVY